MLTEIINFSEKAKVTFLMPTECAATQLDNIVYSA